MAPQIPEEPPQLACRSYTHARRYPWVIGKIGGWQLPTQLTPAQLVTLGASLFVLVQTRALWAHLPRLANLTVEVALPGAGAWAVRHLRMEGRAPLRAFAGAVGYLAAPRRGVVQGRALPRATTLHSRTTVLVRPWPATQHGRRRRRQRP